MCDRSDTSLVIDSAVAVRKASSVKFLLFSANEFYESNPIDSDIDERPKFAKKSIREKHSELEPPIDASYHYESQLYLSHVSLIFITKCWERKFFQEEVRQRQEWLNP